MRSAPHDDVNPNRLEVHMIIGIKHNPVAALLVSMSLAVAAVGVADAPATTTHANGNSVIDWNAVAGEAARAGCPAPTTDPLHEARMYAIAHIAVHDALNAIDRRFEPYAYDARAPRGTSIEAAVATAAHDALVATLADLPAELFGPQCRGGWLGGGRRGKHERARRHPQRHREDSGHRRRSGVRSDDRGPAQRRPCQRRTTRRRQLSARHRTGPVQVHARHALRVRSEVGRGDAVRAAGQLAVRQRSALPV